MKAFLSLFLCVCAGSAAVAAAQPSRHVTAFGVGVGLVDEGNDDKGFAAGLHTRYTAWVEPYFGIGAEAVILSAFDNDCDAGCNANTRAFGGAVRAVLGIGTVSHPREVELGVSVGPFRGHYSRRVAGGTSERDATVLGVTVDVGYSPRLHVPIRPTVALRGTTLPDRFGSRARFATLAIGFLID